MIDPLLSIAIVASIVITLSLKIVLNSGAYASTTHKNTLKLYKDYIRELEVTVEDYKKEMISAKRRMANKEAAPAVAGDLSDISAILPSLLPTIVPKLPKWLQPLASNPEVISSLTKYASENPEKIQSLLGGVLRSAGSPSTTSNKPETTSL